MKNIFSENGISFKVFPSEEYSAFFDTEAGRDYDSGWYSASDDAVRYFMDPRNFLNEQDIFQFEDVSYYDRNYSGGVSGVLDGTFMQSLTLENGMLLRDYLLSIGKELAVSPVHIAARMRQEQGVENTSGMISGECGDLLYYFYNIQATVNTSTHRQMDIQGTSFYPTTATIISLIWELRERDFLRSISMP